MRPLLVLLIPMLLLSCAGDGTPHGAQAPYPVLLPIDQILVDAAPAPDPAPDPAADLTTRANALRARAAVLRQPLP